MAEERKYLVVERRSKSPKDVAVYPATKLTSYNGGYVMEYLGQNKAKEVVYIPRDYEFVHRNGATYVGKVAGNNSAAVLRFGPMVGASVDPDCPGADLSLLVKTDLMARGYRTVYERNIPWKLVLIIGAVVVVAVVVIMFLRGQGAPVPGPGGSIG